MKKVAIKACNGQYVCNEAAGKHHTTANRPHMKEWETWDLIPLATGPNLFALRSHANGLFLCAEEGGDKPLIGNRMDCREWETFQFQFNGNYARFRAVNGKYVSFDGQNLIANAEYPDQNETFLIVFL